MTSIQLLLLMTVVCSAVFPKADAAETALTYSVELVVERLDGSALHGKAECSRVVWCEIGLAGSFQGLEFCISAVNTSSVYTTPPDRLYSPFTTVAG
jgi:hypothetical protein